MTPVTTIGIRTIICYWYRYPYRHPLLISVSAPIPKTGIGIGTSIPSCCFFNTSCSVLYQYWYPLLILVSVSITNTGIGINASLVFFLLRHVPATWHIAAEVCHVPSCSQERLNVRAIDESQRWMAFDRIKRPILKMSHPIHHTLTFRGQSW